MTMSDGFVIGCVMLILVIAMTVGYLIWEDRMMP